MKKLKGMLSLLLVMMLMATLFVGCGSDDVEEDNTDTTEQETSSSEDNVEKELDKVTLQLKWLPQSQFMGYYVADAKGFYEEEGIEIEILPGGSDIIPEQQVYNGVADIGITWVSTLMKYQEQGWEFVHVAQPYQLSGMLLVSKAETGIEEPTDLVGKKVANWFGGNEYEMYSLLEANGIDRDNDLELVQQDYTMNQLMNDEVDAAAAMTYNEYGLLLDAGYEESDLNVFDMNEEGVAMLEDCLFVNAEWLEENEDLLVRFLRASIKGWAAACENPEEAGQIVYDVDQSVSLEHQIYMAQEVAKLVAPEGFDLADIGYTDMDAMQQTADAALRYGLLTEEADLSEDSVTTKYWEEAVGK